MNEYLSRLCRLAQQPSRRIIGLMSGTSLDGLDVALCRLEGHGLGTQFTLEHFATVPYDEEVRRRIRAVFAGGGAAGLVSLEYLTLLNPWLGALHADMVLACLRNWQVAPTEVDLIASHGQTVFHAPAHQHQHPDFVGRNATLQLGDGDQVAVRTGIITLSDFRQKHIAAGGEGAPLAAYGDYLLLSSPIEERLLLNLGGIANFTYLPRRGHDASTAFSTDTGPGNTLLDATVRAHRGLPYDEDGRLALAGHPHEGLLAALLDHPFFGAALPKTTGPELFGTEYLRLAQERSGTQQLSLQDTLATLVELSAVGVTQAAQQVFGEQPALAVYGSGGGAHNPALQAALLRHLPYCRFATTEALGVLPDAKEAILFAVLANEAVAGQPVSIGAGRQRVPAVGMGKISLPG